MDSKQSPGGAVQRFAGHLRAPRRRLTSAISGLAAAGLLSTGALMADPVEVPAELDPFAVRATPEAVSPTVLTPEAARLMLRTEPGAVSVVDASDYAGRHARDFSDTLFAVPGVFVQKRFAEEVRLSIRGSGLSRGFHMRGALLAVDGVPVNLPDGSADFQEIDPLTTAHTEVLRGANGLRYGATGLGGAINLVSVTGRTLDEAFTARLEAGQNRTLRVHASLSDAGERGDVYTAVTGVSASGGRAHADSEVLRFTGNAGWRWSQTQETRAYLAVNRADASIPGALTLRQALDEPWRALPGNVAGRHARNVRSVRAAARHGVVLDGGGRVTAGAYLLDKRLHHPIFQLLDQHGLFWGAFAQARLPAAGLPLEWRVAFNHRDGINRARRYVNDAGRAGALTADAREHASRTDLYLEQRYRATAALELIAGVQLLHEDRDYRDRLVSAGSDRRRYREASPRVGALWRHGENAEVFANVTRSVEAPTFTDLNQFSPFVDGFVPLATQRAWTAEFGHRGSRGGLEWDAAVYRARVDGELLAFSVSSDTPAATFNAGRTMHTGAELALGWRSSDTLALNGAYTFSDLRFDGDAQYGDNRLAGGPPHLLQAGVRWRPISNVQLAPRLEWAPRGAWADYANTQRAPGYAVLHLEGSWALSPRWSAFAELRNLTDRRYVSTVNAVTAFADQAAFHPGQRRTVYAGVRYAH